MIDRHRLQLGVVVSEMDDDLGESGLEVGDRVQVELLPVIARHVRARDDHVVQDDVVRREWHAGHAGRIAADREEWQTIVVRHLDVRRNQVIRGEERPHMAIQVRRMNPQGERPLDLGAKLAFRFH